ncbi:histone methylation DOT1 family protein (Precursor), related [Neospora caninum Liverpool]|uniref:Histone methylation DOT1 family protein (Precursor), related n=1 Tax=Neospora caninum (strain Liverpool) TaxID=572307 RepID=F0VBP6_NEOCL|nr:histone methylation DOT1 family protein (Precursor), related [Neospora caninum Liverpool]CBZ51030.1 histone methylation DOT1 family protein (Precursor), related [Neospora caninum Liverpool]|eukprot:XP_003881063.1 histone methylation DOT1 family protein (Precursor), related [Neospora caninum Liverpool]
MADDCGASPNADAEYSESDSETDWMPFTGTTPDLVRNNFHTHKTGTAAASYLLSSKRLPAATPVNKITRILAHLNLSEADVVYDLGCGDGRVLVECARKNNCSGVGIDLDARLLQRARANAERHQVHRRVIFLKENILDPQLNLSAATVVYVERKHSRNLLNHWNIVAHDGMHICDVFFSTGFCIFCQTHFLCCSQPWKSSQMTTIHNSRRSYPLGGLFQGSERQLTIWLRNSTYMKLVIFVPTQWLPHDDIAGRTKIQKLRIWPRLSAKGLYF